MISKMQKVWLWIFGAMFVVPEVVFFILPSSIINYFLGRDMLNLYSLFVDAHFFINNWIYFSWILTVELIGLLGLLVISIKSKKRTFTILLGVVLLWLMFVFIIGYLSNKINLVM